MGPKGTILIIGGAEDKGDGDNDMENKNKEFERSELLKDLLPHKTATARIQIITTASSVPDDMRKAYIKAFKKIGFKNIDFLDIQDKIEARNPEYTEQVKKSHAVFFTGGDQFKLSAILGGTPM